MSVRPNFYKIMQKGFIVGEGFNTQELATRGSLGALKWVLNPEANSLPQQNTPLLAAGYVD